MQYEYPEKFKDILAVGQVTLGPIELSRQFNDYITQQYPWMGSGIYWSKLAGSIEFDADGFDVAQVKTFLDRTTLSQYQNIAIVYAAWEPCFLLTYSDLFQYFYDLTSVELCFFVGLLDHGGASFSHDFVEHRHRAGRILSGIARTPSAEPSASNNPAAPSE